MNLVNIDYHIVDYCNVNCVSCGHMCPLVYKGEGELPLNEVYEQLTTLYDKSEGGTRFNMLTITGGECTLHPYFEEIVRFAVSKFPGKVRIFSNATNVDKLMSVSDLVGKSTGLLAITVSDYGFKLNSETQHQLINAGISIGSIPRNNSDWNRQFFSHEKINVEADALNCEARSYCTQYVDYKLYICQYAAYFKYFDRAFHGSHNLELNGNEFIDIRNISSWNEVIEFRDNRIIPICYNCLDCQPWRPHQPWGTSKREITEWYG